MLKHFNLKEIIQNQVNKEAIVEWAKTETPPIPVFEKIVVKRNMAGWLNFAKTTLLELRP